MTTTLVQEKFVKSAGVKADASPHVAPSEEGEAEMDESGESEKSESESEPKGTVRLPDVRASDSED